MLCCQIFASNKTEYNVSFEYWLNEDLKIFSVNNVIVLEIEDNVISVASNNWFGEMLLNEAIEFANQSLLENNIFNKTLYIDESREVTNSSMSQCVSYTVASTIERICNTEPIFGVHRIFQDNENVTYILKNLQDLGISIKEL